MKNKTCLLYLTLEKYTLHRKLNSDKIKDVSSPMG